MPLQNRKWSDEQREAMGRAIVDDGLGAREVSRRCAAGTLLDNLAPFGPPPESTVRDCATKYRRRLEGRDRSPASKLEPNAALRQLFERVVSILEHGLETQHRAAQVGRADPVKVGQIGRTLRDLIPVARELETANKATPAPASRPHRRSKAPTLADQLVEDQRRDDRGGQATDGYADTHIGNADQDDPFHETDASLADAGHTDRGEGDVGDGPDSDYAGDSGMDTHALEAAAELRSRLGIGTGPTPERMPLP